MASSSSSSAGPGADPTRLSSTAAPSTPPSATNRPRISDLGAFRVLPREVCTCLLSYLIPPHDCSRSSFDIHDCVLSFGPELKGLKAMSLSCAQLQDIVREFLPAENVPFYFRQEGAKSDYKAGMRVLNASVGSAAPPSAGQYAQREAEIIGHCRQLYGIDAVPDEISYVHHGPHGRRVRRERIAPLQC
jgi:hypothetical protein